MFFNFLSALGPILNLILVVILAVISTSDCSTRLMRMGQCGNSGFHDNGTGI